MSRFLVGFLLSSFLVSSAFAAEGRLVCAGGNEYWGGGVIDARWDAYGQCTLYKYNGHNGLTPSGKDHVLTKTLPVDNAWGDYVAPYVNCTGALSIVQKFPAPLSLTIYYPGIAHGGIEASSENVPCQYNPALPASLVGLTLSDIVAELKK